MSLKIEQVHKYFVGEVSEIDLSDPLSKSEVIQIEEGMDQFGVLIFREQFLSDEEQVSYTKNFGELELHVGSNVVKTLVNGLINANFEIIIFLPIESETMEIFLHSRYLNNYFYLPDMIG